MSYTSLLFQIEDWVHEGEDYLTIKRKIEASDLPEVDQLKLLSRTDDFIVQREHYEETRRQAIAQMILGGTIFIVGFMFWYFVTNTGKGQRALFAITLMGGLYILKKGWNKYKLPPRQFATLADKKNKFDRYRTKTNE